MDDRQAGAIFRGSLSGEDLLAEFSTGVGGKAAIVPVRRLQELRLDLDDLKNRESLNGFQRYIISDLFCFDLPEVGFEIRSILIFATPSPAAIRFTFRWQGRPFSALLPASYAGKDCMPTRIEQYLGGALGPLGYHAVFNESMPIKRLAVRSGLARYGRNNIGYVEGMGSFLNLNPFYTDLPCEDSPWHKVRMLDECLNCHACLRRCPTGAIRPDRFLIDNERCLTYFNEAGPEYSFPEWIDPRAHHTVYGCMQCQLACPANQPFITEPETVEFTEEETTCIMTMAPYDSFPQPLRQKLERYEMKGFLGALPRNLRAIAQQTP